MKKYFPLDVGKEIIHLTYNNQNNLGNKNNPKYPNILIKICLDCYMVSYLSPGHVLVHFLVHTAKNIHCTLVLFQMDMMALLWFDCAWSQGSRELQMEHLVDPLILEHLQGQVDQENL